MKKHLEKHKIASLIILVLAILILSILFVPQLNPVLKTIENLVAPNPESNPSNPASDYHVSQDENNGGGSGGGSSGNGGNPFNNGSGPPSDTPEYLNSETYRTCIHTLIIQKCKEYFSPSSEIAYEEGLGYFKCYNQFAVDQPQQEIKLNVPLRILYNRCGYQLKLTEKEKCLKNMYIEMCLENDLEYTEYNTALGTLKCTDDGFYIESDSNIHERFLELEVTEEMIENRCG